MGQHNLTQCVVCWALPTPGHDGDKTQGSVLAQQTSAWRRDAKGTQLLQPSVQHLL